MRSAFTIHGVGWLSKHGALIVGIVAIVISTAGGLAPPSGATRALLIFGAAVAIGALVLDHRAGQPTRVTIGHNDWVMSEGVWTFRVPSSVVRGRGARLYLPQQNGGQEEVEADIEMNNGAIVVGVGSPCELVVYLR